MNITIEDSNVMTVEKIADALKERNWYDTCAFDEKKGVFTAERDGQKYEIDLGGWIRKVDANTPPSAAPTAPRNSNFPRESRRPTAAGIGTSARTRSAPRRATASASISRQGARMRYVRS